ncbi:hypothetical protein AB1M95_03690 [Sulfitobacter sp. LCG007]
MSGRSMTQDAMLASLQDIRLPEASAGAGVADVFVVIGLTALLALAVLAVLGALGLRNAPLRRVSMPVRVAEALRLPAGPRRVALLHLIRERDPLRYAVLAEGHTLYRRGGLKLEAIEEEARKLV